MIFLTIGALIIIVGLILICFLAYDSFDNFWSTILCIIGGILVGASITEIKHENSPNALDVYRGNTTLEITYRDSVAIDSVVVFNK